MAYVPVPKDLTKVKTKVAFNLTKRQIICFTAALILGLPVFFLLKRNGVVLIDTKTWRAGVYVRLGSRAYRWVAGAVLPGRFTPAESTSLARSVEQMRGAGVPVVGAVVAVWPSGAGRVRLGLMRYAGARRIAAARRAVRVAARMAGARGTDEVVVERVLRWAGASEEGR